MDSAGASDGDFVPVDTQVHEAERADSPDSVIPSAPGTGKPGVRTGEAATGKANVASAGSTAMPAGATGGLPIAEGQGVVTTAVLAGGVKRPSSDAARGCKMARRATT